MKTLNFTLNKIVPINNLRRKFSEIENALPYIDHFILTKKGKPFAILSATGEAKKNILKKTAGAFKKTALDKDSLWREVFRKKSRKLPIRI